MSQNIFDWNCFIAKTSSGQRPSQTVAPTDGREAPTVSGSTVSITGTEASHGCYTASTGALAKNTYPTDFNYRQEVLLVHVFNGSTIETRRIRNTCTPAYSDTYTESSGLGPYWTIVGCTLSHDLTLAVCNSNGGKPDEDEVLLFTTGTPQFSSTVSRRVNYR